MKSPYHFITSTGMSKISIRAFVALFIQMKKITLFFLLFSIGLAAIAQDLKEMRIVGKAKKLDSGEMVARRDQNGNYCAAIQVVSDMDGFSYDSFDGIVGQIDDNPGKDMVYLTFTERVLEIFKTGYKPLKIILSDLGITLKPQEIWKVEIAGNELISALPVTFRFTPSDARLTIDGKPAGTAAMQSLAMGNHAIKLEKDGYQTIEETIAVSETKVFFEWTMKKAQDAALQIETTPEGATIYLDDIKLGESPVAAFYKPGIYPVRIVKEGYVSLENQTLEVKLPKTTKSYTLEENVGYLTVNTHAGATVYFNDQKMDNPKNVKLAPQLVKIKVTMPKAENLEEQVALKRNDKLILEMFPVVQTGTLQVAVTPFDAMIELTGDAGEYYTSDGMKVFEDIPVGTYTLKATANGYESIQESVILKMGEKQDKSFRLNMITATTKQASKNLKIGDKAHGGIVFYLDGNGGGLVCAEKDQSVKAVWGCDGITIGSSTGIGTGLENTQKIENSINKSNTAAKICSDLVLNGYNDWFLPSKDELNLMYVNLKKTGIGGFASAYYWSSSEYSSNYAWGQYFGSGDQNNANKGNALYVRAVRAF